MSVVAAEGGRPRGLGWLLLITLGILACFVNKAFTIDDPLFLWLGEHLQSDPIDFYGYDVLWTGQWEPMHNVTQNPPLTGYVIAVASALFGMSEVALHSVFLIAAGLAAWGIFALGVRFTSSPLRAGLIAVLSPVFLISSTNVMSDTMMLAFYCWALVFWLRGIDEERTRDLFVAGLLAGLGIVTKYFAVSLVPLFVAYALLKRRSLRTWPWGLLPALAIAAAYEIAANVLYGHGLLLGAAGYATSFREEEGVKLLQQGGVGLVFAGGCVVAPLAFAPRLWSWKWTVPALVAALVATLTFRTWFPWVGVPIETSSPMTVGVAAQVIAFATAGALLLALAVEELRGGRDPDAWLLFLWTLGTFVFAAFVNWVNNGRSNLPLAPVAAFLVMRRLERRQTGGTLPFALCLAPAALISLAAAYADYAWANGVRRNAIEIAETYVPRAPSVKFLGTWGFQYYLQRAGATGVDGTDETFRPGDLLVIPNNNNKIDLQGVGEPYAELLARRIEPDRFPLWTMSWENHAGFYASNYGPLPYGFGRATSDFYELWRVKRGFRVFETDDE